MKTYRMESGNIPLLLTTELAHSGEGQVWATDSRELVAKLYHVPTTERIDKLRAMIANPPEHAVVDGHIELAWPSQLLLDAVGKPVGFVMPRVHGAHELTSVYNPLLRKRKQLAITWQFLHTTAKNFAHVASKLHAQGHVLGDIKSQNILVNNRAQVSIIDTDSFQIIDTETGHLFRCLVGSEGFTPPELIGQNLSAVIQSELHDRFRIGVVAYLLLFGYTPFKGTWCGPGEAPALDELIRQGYWPYRSGGPLQPGPNDIPLEVLAPDLQECFQRCFDHGHDKPQRRPPASEWADVLERSARALLPCPDQDGHFHARGSTSCPWCIRTRVNGVNIFEQAAGDPRPTSSASAAGRAWLAQRQTHATGLTVTGTMAPDDRGDPSTHHDYILTRNGVASTFVWIPIFEAYQLIRPARCGKRKLMKGSWLNKRPPSGMENQDWCKETFGGFYAGKYTASRADAQPERHYSSGFRMLLFKNRAATPGMQIPVKPINESGPIRSLIPVETDRVATPREAGPEILHGLIGLELFGSQGSL